VIAEELPKTSGWMRLLWGGVSLVPFEQFLLVSLVQHVTGEMAGAIRAQWQGFNLIQRSPDWQELRFYRRRAGRVDRSDLPKLPVREGEVKLLSVTLHPENATDLLHVNFWAVDGWFFNLNADRALRPFRACSTMSVQDVEHSYRSNLVHRGA
jgi:hypothetical protein